MTEKTRILVVEDDMIIAANISLQLTNLGYEVTGIETRGEEAILNTNVNPPDIILMDINLRGALDGVQTAQTIQKKMDIPIIYLTANTDEASFLRAKETRPLAFITKPFNKLNLQRTIALAVERLRENEGKKEFGEKMDLQILDDRIFVRHNGKMAKLLLDDILYIEADRNYCTIFTTTGNYVLTSTLKTMHERLPSSKFVRVHRSYMVNIGKLDVVGESHLEIGRIVIPFSKSQREFLLGRLHTI
ncbi:LytR/AlgR family response regulator transcription factor [Ulvibacterium marinum]|uniref:DNA-binding response regulator n=1 Tax=Ulvibacterium marinum TaxID=2419782 RepID=A0A3B0C847_9FLAO|nr:response regulator [Ulvibacterium marinum]RKN81680.1 DNA-binding response regulator [Ulvibacterium marinum]